MLREDLQAVPFSVPTASECLTFSQSQQATKTDRAAPRCTCVDEMDRQIHTQTETDRHPTPTCQEAVVL